ncbi:MAG: UDP-N-acetylglucosamine 2-epimerase (non-hydrolyzing) [Pseudomonadota bacterium]|jgi:UDP-N-acetylglucosamine 2-epimerase (non-hydrolysing)|nr:UDP-N-acetylglucosamine 2-epimerase (non-hydrolyzing) [Pseudomonadota bacterium]
MSGAGAVLCVVGARPNYMKMAPLLRAIKARSDLPPTVLVHTGQHYDFNLNDRLFVDLDLPPPEVNLEVGSGSHAMQTAEVMKRFEPVVDQYRPSCVVVVGDVNSTLACSLVASKKSVDVAHVEAGLRSFDRSMPEEINRVLTDQIAAWLYTTERSAHANLAREGISGDRVHFVGNLMIDSLRSALPRAIAAAELFRRSGLDGTWANPKPGYAAVTLHRPSNVDDRQTLSDIVATLGEMGRRMPVIWPVHPRTRANIEKFGLGDLLQRQRIACLPPQGYLEMAGLMRDAALVLTDSGGVQEETTALGVPCLTMRSNTERPITIDEGTNTLVGVDRGRILAAVDDVLRTGGKRGRIPEYWDGNAAPRIAEHMAQWLASIDSAHVRQGAQR